LLFKSNQSARRGGINRWIALTLLVIMLAGFIGGCQAIGGDTQVTTMPAVTGDTTATSSAAETTTGTTAIDRGPSGPLRLWWTPHQTFNPLLDKSRSGQAAATLVFDSLYEADAQRQMQPVLALDWQYYKNAGQMFIQIRNDVLFHDGQPLTPADVKATIDFILASKAASPYYAGLATVASCALINKDTVILNLKKDNPWLLHALDFPILPAKSLAATARPQEMIAGTGRYKMTSYSPKTGLLLTLAKPAADKPNQLLHIYLREYASMNLAMKAFENDQLDMVSMPESDLADYTLRNSLRLERYTSNQFVMIAMNTSSGRPMSVDRNLVAYKLLCLSGNWQTDNPLLPGEAADLPVAAAFGVLGRKPVNTSDILTGLMQTLNPKLQPGIVPHIASPLTILVPQDNPLLTDLAKQLQKWLSAQKQACSLKLLAAPAYKLALNGGAYDLAFCEFNLPTPAEPGWLYLNPPTRVVAGAATLPQAGLADYEKWRNKLTTGLPLWQKLDEAAPTDADTYARQVIQYHEILSQTAARSPFAGILLREAGLAYGDRVSGQCYPTINQPYQGIEELWVWSGQSS
jgi:hypothetical protein